MATPKSKKGASAPPADEFRKPTRFEEWKGEVVSTRDEKTDKVTRTFKKFERIRENIVISQEEADALNEGVLHGGNTHCSMYFPAPEQAEKDEKPEE